MKLELLDFTLEALQDWCIENGEKPYRAKQIFKWIYQKRVESFFDMSDISKQSQEK